MAKQTLFGEGKNAVQQTAHIRSSKGPMGFSSSNKLTNTNTQFSPGVPVRNSNNDSNNIDGRSHVVADNPYNPFDRNEGPTVLAGTVKAQNAGRYADSPVPSGGQMPHKDMVSKAQEVSSAMVGDTPPSDGVLGRG